MKIPSRVSTPSKSSVGVLKKYSVSVMTIIQDAELLITDLFRNCWTIWTTYGAGQSGARL